MCRAVNEIQQVRTCRFETSAGRLQHATGNLWPVGRLKNEPLQSRPVWPDLMPHRDGVGRPQQLRPRHGGRQVRHARGRRDVDARRDEVDDGQMLGKMLLHLVEEPLTFRLVGGGDLPRHQLVDPFLPLRRRSFLHHVPEVHAA